LRITEDRLRPTLTRPAAAPVTGLAISAEGRRLAGGELAYLIAQQAREIERDALGFPVKYGPTFRDDTRIIAA